MDTEHEFEVWQNGGSVAWVNCGDRARAVAEISHYAAVYSKDGPVEVFEVKRVPFDPARSEAQPSGYDGGESLGERPIRPDLAIGAITVAMKTTTDGEVGPWLQTALDFLTGEYEPLDDAALTFTASLSDASPSSGDE